MNITREKYNAIRDAIVEVLGVCDGPDDPEGPGVSLRSIAGMIAPMLPAGLFPEDGKGITWYVMAVKQDLEARGEIEQVPGVKPQRLQLASARN